MNKETWYFKLLLNDPCLIISHFGLEVVLLMIKVFIIFTRLLTQSTREKIYLDILNRSFDSALVSLRKIPNRELDYGLLQTFLSRSCQWGDIQSVNYIWYKFVMQLPILLVAPNLLCDIGNLALHTNKSFMPNQLYIHYLKFHSHLRGEDDPYKYELLRIRVESFAIRNNAKKPTSFKENWRVYVEGMDNQLPPTVEIKVRDFPFLTKSMGKSSKHEILELLFNSKDEKLFIQNRNSLTLLLNMFLLQSDHHMEFKISCFVKFSQVYSLKLDESLAILFRQFRNDGYHLSRLMDFARKKGVKKLSPVASRAFLEGISSTDYRFEAESYRGLLSTD